MRIQLKVCIHNCFIVKYDIWIAASIQLTEVNHYTLCRISQQEGSKQRLCPHWQQKLPTATTGYADWSTGQQKDLDPLDPRAGYKWVRKQSAGITLSVESAFRSRQHILSLRLQSCLDEENLARLAPRPSLDHHAPACSSPSAEFIASFVKATTPRE